MPGPRVSLANGRVSVKHSQLITRFMRGDRGRDSVSGMMASSDNTKSAQSVTDTVAVDTVANRYRLERKIGAGGMGSVWLAHDLLLDATCAVKIIDRDKAADEEIRMRFAREAKASAQLRSPHVVDVFDYGEWAGTHYIAMEFLEGEDLSTRLSRQGRLSPEVTYRIIAHVARALMSAHAQGIVHRDLKPENIFLVQNYGEEIAKVLDFGIAQHNAYSLENKATREGTFLGTPCYMSPEQARGKPIDNRSDLWSLGVIAYQCLTGFLPFEADAIGEVMGRILYEPIPLATTFNPDLPAAVDTWWERASARDREDRFQSAKELTDELGVVLGLEIVVTVPSVPPRMGSIPPVEQSGLVAAYSGNPNAADAGVPALRGMQTSIVKVVSAMAATLDEQQDSEATRASRTQLSPNFAQSIWRRFKALRSRVKWLIVAVPAVFALILLGVYLGVSLSAKPGTTASSGAPSGSAIVAEGSKASVARPPIVPAQPETLTVDQLPLVPSGQSTKGAADKRPPPSPANANPAKSARDYGI